MTSKIINFSRTRGAPVQHSIQERCVQRILQCHHVLGTTMPFPTISFDLRGTTAGQAYPQKHHIRLNGQLLNENIEHFIEHTVAHEWAHLATHFHYGHAVKAHGQEWKRTMLALGLQPQRCHMYSTTKARKSRKVLQPIVPPGKPASVPLWNYAKKLALKKGLAQPHELRCNTDILVLWIDKAIRVKRRP